MNAVNECAAIKSHGRRFQMSNDFRDVDMLLNWVDDRPIVVPKGADRRRSQRARSTDRIFKGLLYLFAVNERHEWSHKRELFDDTRYRATSWSELCALGRRSGADGDYSREQLRRVLKRLTDKGLLDRVKIHNGGKGEEGWKSRLFIRLRFDKLNSTVNWLRGFKSSRSLPPSPPAKSRKKTSKKQVVPTEKANQSLFGSSSVTSVIQPALVYTNIEIEHIASGKVSVFAEAGDQVTSDSAIQVNQETSRKAAGFFNLKNITSISLAQAATVVNAAANDFQSRSIPSNAAPSPTFLPPPVPLTPFPILLPNEEGDFDFRKITKLIDDNFPEATLTFQHTKQIRGYLLTTALARKMSLKRLENYFADRSQRLGNGEWEFNCSLDVFLGAWPLILCKLMSEDAKMTVLQSLAGDAADYSAASIERGFDLYLEDTKKIILGHYYNPAAPPKKTYFDFDDCDHRQGDLKTFFALAAYRQLGRDTRELLRDDADYIATRMALRAYPAFAIELKKRFPEIGKLLKLDDDFWLVIQNLFERRYLEAVNNGQSVEVWTEEK